jgi:hypothetical protein
MIPQCWKNQPGGGQKPQCSFQCKSPWVPPTEAGMEKAEEHRKYVIESKCRKKRKEKDLRVKILKRRMKKCIKFLRMYTLRLERRIVSKNHSTAEQVTAELKIHLEDPVSTKTV